MITLTGILFISHSWLILYILVGILAIFYGATFPIYGACAGDYFPKELMGTVIGSWAPFYWMGAILVHWFTGMIRDTTGSYHFAFGINAVMAALGFFFFLMLEKAPQPSCRTWSVFAFQLRRDTSSIPARRPAGRQNVLKSQDSGSIIEFRTGSTGMTLPRDIRFLRNYHLSYAVDM